MQKLNSSEPTYVMDDTSVGIKMCHEVISDFDITIQGPELFGRFDDPARLQKLINQESYYSYYWGAELGLVFALSASIYSIYSKTELKELFIDNCMNRKSSDRFFSVVKSILNIKFAEY